MAGPDPRLKLEPKHDPGEGKDLAIIVGVPDTVAVEAHTLGRFLWLLLLQSNDEVYAHQEAIA